MRLLLCGDEALPAMRRAIRGARHRVHLQTMLFFDDEAGRAIADDLIDRAQAGVPVRLLFEFLNTRLQDVRDRGPRTAALVQRLREAGVDVLDAGEFPPPLVDRIDAQVLLSHLDRAGPRRHLDRARGWLREAAVWETSALRRAAQAAGFGDDVALLDHLLRMLVHDHRKLLVVDGQVGFLGGMNVGREYLYDSAAAAWETWHDAHARLRGPAVADLERLFARRWSAMGGGELAGADGGVDAPAVPAEPEPGPCTVTVLSKGPLTADEIGDALLAALAGARRIRLINPYLVREALVEALASRARAGADVAVVVPDESNDSRLMQACLRSHQPALLEAGVRVVELRGRMTHAKVAVVDDATLIGSYNFNHRSAHVDFEVAAWVEDAAFTEDVVARLFAPLLEEDASRSAAELRPGWIEQERIWLARKLVDALPDLF